MRKRRTKSWERFPKIEKIEYDCDRRIWYYTRLHIYNNRCLFWNSCFSFQMKRKAHTRGAFLPTEKRLMRQQRAVHSSSAQRHWLRKTKLAWKTHRRYWNVTIWYFLVIAGPVFVYFLENSRASQVITVMKEHCCYANFTEHRQRIFYNSVSLNLLFCFT